MQFDTLRTSGSGSSHVALNFQDMGWYDHTPFTYRTVMHPYLREPSKHWGEGRERLDLTWHHWIFFKGAEVFRFHSYSETYISEKEIAPTLEQLAELVGNSFKQLQSNWEERRGEYFILPAVPDISPDTIQQTAFQLMVAFLPEPE